MSATELPVLVNTKTYAGDFHSHVRRCAAPFFSGDFARLLKAAAVCRIRPVLLFDAINECPSQYLDDFLADLQAFALQHGARLVGTSQTDPQLAGHLRSDVVRMSLPQDDEKQTIYAYHAGLAKGADVAYLSAPFTNAYDLAVAGACHSSHSSPSSRADLYDRYVRRSLPKDAAVASAFLRDVADQMAQSFSLVMRRSAFERKAERFLAAQQVPLAALDDLMRCRLLDVSEDCVSFEHELLFDYFRAEHLLRQFPSVAELAAELRRPRNHSLFEFVLPRFSDEGDMEELLPATSSADALCRVIDGKCGSPSKLLLEQQCEALLHTALLDLPNITIRCESVKLESGQSRFIEAVIENHRTWSAHDRNLCVVIARNLHLPGVKSGFLSLFDATERHLKQAADIAAKASRFRPAAVWGEIVRQYGGTLQFGTVTLPCAAILGNIASSRMSLRSAAALPIVEDLLIRAEGGGHFALGALTRDLPTTGETVALDVRLSMAQRGLETRIYIVMMDSIELLQSMNREMDRASEEQLRRLHDILDGPGPDDIMLNGLWFELLASYGKLALVVTLEQAVAEVRSVINWESNSESLTELAELEGMSVERLVSGLAYGCLCKIFEDVFQGVYFEAYESLDAADRLKLLCLAARADDAAFWSEWILSELLKHGGDEVVAICGHWASGIDGQSAFPQDVVASFILAIEGWARHRSVPPEYRSPISVDDAAWRAMGELLYWHFRQTYGQTGTARIHELWAQLASETPDAMADVLFRLRHSQWKVRERPCPIQLEKLYPDQVRPLLERSVERRASLTTFFRHGGARDRDVMRHVLRTLGDIGNQNTISLLSGLVEDPELGAEAIQAIAAIRSRLDKP